MLSIRDGDQEAFTDLYKATKNLLYTVIFHVVQDTTLTEDILQELFLKLYLSPHIPSRNPRAYLCRMARNLAIDTLRKQKTHVALKQVEDFLSTKDIVESQAIDIENAIQSLPERERQIIVLHIQDEFSFREIAVALEIPLGTVYWVYQKTVKQLRTMLGDVS